MDLLEDDDDTSSQEFVIENKEEDDEGGESGQGASDAQPVMTEIKEQESNPTETTGTDAIENSEIIDSNNQSNGITNDSNGLTSDSQPTPSLGESKATTETSQTVTTPSTQDQSLSDSVATAVPKPVSKPASKPMSPVKIPSKPVTAKDPPVTVNVKVKDAEPVVPQQPIQTPVVKQQHTEKPFSPNKPITKQDLEFKQTPVAISAPPKDFYSDFSNWYRKEYLGGYRRRQVTGDRQIITEFFHASTQTTTAQELRAMNAPTLFHRDTQTKFTKNRRNQGPVEKSTQMTGPGVYVTILYDRTKWSGQYETADEHEVKVNNSILSIQCFIRRCFAIRKVNQLRKIRDDKLRSVSEQEARRRDIISAKKHHEIESRLHPKNVKDFTLLYSGLESWRQQETKRINNAGYSEPARLTALSDLLVQESVLIQKLDRLKIAAEDENKEQKVLKLLDKMSAPKKWIGFQDAPILVDNPETIRARELRDLYHALNLPLLTIDERLQILLHVKFTVKEFDCNLTRDIVDLIDREGDLVSRGRGAASLEGLRKRIASLFLQFILTPEFNPIAEGFQKFTDTQVAAKKEAEAVYYCRGCTQYLPSTDFFLSTTMKHLGRCKKCTAQENAAHQRQDDSVYTRLLKLIRIQESIKRDQTGIPKDPHYNAINLLQETDMHYLIDVMWNRSSAIGGSSEMDDLILTRWNRKDEFSPWNSILLTKQEAVHHDKHPEPFSLYTDEFVAKMAQKHLTARTHFARLPLIEKYLHSLQSS